MYVGKAREHTDIHNAKVIEDTVSNMVIPNVDDIFLRNESELGCIAISFAWFEDIKSLDNDSISINSSSVSNYESYKNFINILQRAFPDGLPAPKQKGAMFFFRIKGARYNNVSTYNVGCKVCKNESDIPNANYPVVSVSKLPKSILGNPDVAGFVEGFGSGPESSYITQYKFNPTFAKNKFSVYGSVTGFK